MKLRERIPEARVAYFEGRMSELRGYIAARKADIKDAQAKLRMLVRLWHAARRSPKGGQT